MEPESGRFVKVKLHKHENGNWCHERWVSGTAKRPAILGRSANLPASEDHALQRNWFGRTLFGHFHLRQFAKLALWDAIVWVGGTDSRGRHIGPFWNWLHGVGVPPERADLPTTDRLKPRLHTRRECSRFAFRRLGLRPSNGGIGRWHGPPLLAHHRVSDHLLIRVDRRSFPVSPVSDFRAALLRKRRGVLRLENFPPAPHAAANAAEYQRRVCDEFLVEMPLLRPGRQPTRA